MEGWVYNKAYEMYTREWYTIAPIDDGRGRWGLYDNCERIYIGKDAEACAGYAKHVLNVA